MEVILTQRCKSLTGELGSGFGYHIQRRKNGFFAKRNSKGVVPPDGHWKFIVSCAELAKNGFMLSDIQVNGYELKAALTEACFFASALDVDLDNEYNAAQVLQFKNERGL